MKTNGCIGCHQIGRALHPHHSRGLQGIPRRRSLDPPRPGGPGGQQQMVNQLAGALGGVPFKYYGEWTDKIAAGALPFEEARASARGGAQCGRSRCATGWMKSTICMTRSPATNAIRPSMPTGRWSVRRKLSSDNLPIMDPVTTRRRLPGHVPERDGGRRRRRKRSHRGGRSAAALGLLGRRGDLGFQGGESQRHVRA